MNRVSSFGTLPQFDVEGHDQHRAEKAQVAMLSPPVETPSQVSMASISGVSEVASESDKQRNSDVADLSVDMSDIMNELLHHNETMTSPYAVSEELEPFFTEGETALFEAARTGDLEVLQRYIDSGASLEVQDAGVGFTLMHQACRCGQLEAVKLLAAAGANIEAGDFSGRRPLHRASAEGQRAVVAELIRLGANVNCRDGTDRVPLHRAARWGHKLTCELLLDNGADVEAADSRFRRTALHFACRAGGVNTLRTLLLRGANVHALTSVGNTALHLACDRCLVDKVRLLLEWGCDPAKCNRTGQVAAEAIGMWADDAVRLEILDLLEHPPPMAPEAVQAAVAKSQLSWGKHTAASVYRQIRSASSALLSSRKSSDADMTKPPPDDCDEQPGDATLRNTDRSDSGHHSGSEHTSEPVPMRMVVMGAENVKLHDNSDQITYETVNVQKAANRKCCVVQ